MPDSPVASTPSQNAASSSSVVSAAGASEPSTLRKGARAARFPNGVGVEFEPDAEPSSLSVPQAKHAREMGSGYTRASWSASSGRGWGGAALSASAPAARRDHRRGHYWRVGQHECLRRAARVRRSVSARRAAHGVDRCRTPHGDRRARQRVEHGEHRAPWAVSGRPGVRDRGQDQIAPLTSRRGEAWRLSWSCDNFRCRRILADKHSSGRRSQLLFFLQPELLHPAAALHRGNRGTEVEIGIVMGVYNAVGILCQPLVGRWSTRLGVGASCSSALASSPSRRCWRRRTVDSDARVRSRTPGVAFRLLRGELLVRPRPDAPSRRAGRWYLRRRGLVATAVAPLIGRDGPPAGISPALLLSTPWRSWRRICLESAARAPGPAAGGGSLWERGGLDELRHRTWR